MKLTLTEPRLLRDSLVIISDLVNEINFKVAKDKVEIIAIDPANVAMVVFKLLSSSFSEYEVENEKILGVNLVNLTQILKRAKPTDILSMELDEERNRLKISLKGTTSRNFDLALIDIEEKEQKIPNLKYSSKIVTNNILFNEAIEDMDVVANSLSLELQGDKFLVHTEGSLSAGKVEINADEETEINNPAGEEFVARYSVEYLKKIMKGAKLANNVSLEFGQDYPLRAEYRITDKLSLMFILAPRIAND